jgi:hypothetical protein
MRLKENPFFGGRPLLLEIHGIDFRINMTAHESDFIGIFYEELLSENTTTKSSFDFAVMEKHYGEPMKMKDSAGDVI